MTKSIRSIIVTILIAAVALSAVMPFISADVNAASKKKPAKVKMKRFSLIDKYSAQYSVSWKKAKNAKKYEVRMKKGSSSWKKVKTYKKDRKFHLFVAKYGVKYQFKVRGLNGKKKGKFSKPISGTFKPATKFIAGKWFTFKEGTFSETIKIETNNVEGTMESKVDESSDGGVRFTGKTKDGNEILYKRFSDGRVMIVVCPDIKQSKDYNVPVVDIRNCYLEISDDNNVWYQFGNSNQSLSWTINGVEPKKGIGKTEGLIRGEWSGKANSGRFTIGNISRYPSIDVITEGSVPYDNNNRKFHNVNYSKSYNPKVVDTATRNCVVFDEETIFTPQDDEDGYIEKDAKGNPYRVFYKKLNEPEIIRARIYDGNKRVCEIYTTYCPEKYY